MRLLTVTWPDVSSVNVRKSLPTMAAPFARGVESGVSLSFWPAAGVLVKFESVNVTVEASVKHACRKPTVNRHDQNALHRYALIFISPPLPLPPPSVAAVAQSDSGCAVLAAQGIAPTAG